MSAVNLSRELYLCGGTQSSGSTLISWCFLQHPELNGHLDADNDLLPALPFQPYATWYKTTIGCFRLSELMAHFREDGWQIRPALVVRDVRQVWASLCQKPYGKNGNTAEDPPLRMRLRRFKEDWELFRRNDWPMIRYESFVTEPVPTLQRACKELGLPWSKSMITWPKPRCEVNDMRHGNLTFRESCGQGLLSSLRPRQDSIPPDVIPPEDLEWLETEFAEFNRENGYTERLELPGGVTECEPRSVPSFEVTRRFKWELRRKPLRWITHRLGIRQRRKAG